MGMREYRVTTESLEFRLSGLNKVALFTNCVTLGNLPQSSVPQFSGGLKMAW